MKMKKYLIKKHEIYTKEVLVNVLPLFSFVKMPNEYEFRLHTSDDACERRIQIMVSRKEVRRGKS